MDVRCKAAFMIGQWILIAATCAWILADNVSQEGVLIIISPNKTPSQFYSNIIAPQASTQSLDVSGCPRVNEANS
jgi:hypothetical protein